MCFINKIDATKTNESFIEGVPTLNLYLQYSDIECPNCKHNHNPIRGSKTIKIKHALFNKSYCELLFHKRVFKCKFCLHIYSESLGSFVTSKNCTMFLEGAILDDLRNLNNTYKDVALKYHVSSSYVIDLFDERVSIRPGALSSVISIDEVYGRKLTESKYTCLIYDPLNNITIDMLYSRHKERLSYYFENKNILERNKVEYFIIDLYDTYREIAHKYLRNALVVADSFHVIKNLSDCFKAQRIKTMKEHKESRDYSMNYWLFKNFFWMLNKNIDEIKRDTYDFKKWKMTLSKYQIIEYMLEVDEELKEAYYIKEAYREFNSVYKVEPNGDTSFIREQLETLIDCFKKAKSKYIREFYKTLCNWKEEIINSFTYINGWRLSNCKIERNNGKIKSLMNRSFGFTNFIRTRNRILYSLNSDEPVSSKRQYKSNRRHKTKN